MRSLKNPKTQQLIYSMFHQYLFCQQITINQHQIVINRYKNIQFQTNLSMSTIINPQPELEMDEVQMSQPENQKNEEIEEINPISLLKQPQLFRETFLKIIKNAHQFFKTKDIEKGLIFFNKAIDMLDLGKNILKETTSRYLKISIFANLAYGYQNLRKLQKSNRFCERARQQLQKLISLTKNEENSIEKYLKLSKFLITLKFQHCAILSQLQQHDKALEICKSTLPQLKQQIQGMLKYLRQNSASKLLQKKSGQTVQFSRQVHKFAQSLLVDLLGFLNEPLKRFHFYYWQKNPQKNEQQIRKKFIPTNLQAKNQSKRSILGVSKSNSWMDEFNIGSIMHMSTVTVEDFESSLPMEEYFFKDKLYEIVILCSLSYFTMATQIRFIEPEKPKQPSERQIEGSKSSGKEQSNDKIQQQGKDPNEQQKSKIQSADYILKKYGYEQRTQLHKLSQLYHLRSIEIISKHIQSVIPYLMHIIKSYDKHYLKKKQLQPIAAINQQSQLSLLNQSVKQCIPYPQQKIYNDYMKKQSQKYSSDQLMDQLLLQSQDNHKSIPLSRNKSDQKSIDLKNQDLAEVKNVLDFNQLEDNQSMQNNAVKMQNISKAKKNLSKIIEDPKLQSQIYLHNGTPSGENSHLQQNQIVSGQYLKSKKQIQLVKSPKKNKNSQPKRTKSKSKLNLIKNRQKSKSINVKKPEKSNQKNIYTHRSPNQEKKSVSRSHYESNKSLATTNMTQGIIKKFHSPDLMTINQSKKRLKTHLSDKSRQKLLKKFVGIPNHETEQKGSAPNSNKNGKNSDKKKNYTKQGQKKKQEQKYYTTFDGQKQYRIKHQSTTHIKVLYKKKNVHDNNQHNQEAL